MTSVVFGDVHGDLYLLRKLVRTAREQWGPGVKFFGVGDYIDRGPDSKGVIDFMVSEGIGGICGNHELWFARWLSGFGLDDGVTSRIMGGLATLASYGLSEQDAKSATSRMMVPSSHHHFIQHLPISMNIQTEGPTYWLIHAGLKVAVGHSLVEGVKEALGSIFKQLPPGEQDHAIFQGLEFFGLQSALWVHFRRGGDDLFRLPGGGVQVVGHTPLRDPLDGGHFIALDVGCPRSDRLAGVAIQDDGSRTLFMVGR